MLETAVLFVISSMQNNVFTINSCVFLICYQCSLFEEKFHVDDSQINENCVIKIFISCLINFDNSSSQNLIVFLVASINFQ